jgi:serine protease Do
MFRYSFILLISAAIATAASAQSPEAKKESDRAGSVLAWTLDGAGGYLGIHTEEVTRENFGKFGLSGVRGVAIGNVVEGSPADKAGLQAGDVIVRFNGEEITSGRKLTRLVGEVSPDHTVRLTVFRSGAERDVSVTIGKRPTPRFEDGGFSITLPERLGQIRIPRRPDTPDAPIAPEGPGDHMIFRATSARQIGVGITPLTKQLAEHFGVTHGVMINNVREDSPAAKAGLRAGDIIVAVEGIDVNGDIDVIRAIAGKKEGDVTMTIVRDRSRQTVQVTPEEVKGNFNQFFEFPEGGGQIRLARPGVPAAPVPLNRLLVPGRIL